VADPIIPPVVADFIAANIDSVAEMEALLLLREQQGESWSGERVAERLYTNPGDALRALKALTGRGLLRVEDNAYQYAPAEPRLGELVEQLAETYRTRLIAITKLIHNKKSSNVQLFADVFRFRKDD
jgi:hypothetical protein